MAKCRLSQKPLKVFLWLSLIWMVVGCHQSTSAEALRRDLLFTADEGDHVAIWGVNQDGGDMLLWRDDFKQIDDIAWQADGSAVAVLGLHKTNGRSISIQQRQTGKQMLAAVPMTVTSQLSWSPTGKEILFSAMRNGSESIFSFDTTTGDLSQLTPSPAWTARNPHWSPDGKFIAFESLMYPECSGTCPSRISLFDRQTTNIQQITVSLNPEAYYPKQECLPVWSPDGTKLAFQDGCGPDGMPWRLYVYDVQSHTLLPFISPGEKVDQNLGDQIIDWLPDGKAYLRSDLYGSSQFIVVNTITRDAHAVEVLQKPFNFESIDVSRNGEWVIWTDGTRRLWVTNIVENQNSDLQLAGCDVKLSQSSLSIAFTRNCLQRNEADNGLWVSDLTGKNPVKVSSNLTVEPGERLWSWTPH